MRDMKKEAAEVVATLAARGIGIEILEANFAMMLADNYWKDRKRATET
jgi:hypothetical protein